MKRILPFVLLLLCAIMTLTLVACDFGGDDVVEIENTHTVTFDSAGIGAEYLPQTVRDGETAVPPTEYARDGYRFDGWYCNGALYDFSAPVTSDITVNAKWKKLHTVTVVVSEEDTRTETVADGATLATLSEPEREGYRFDGWHKDGTAYDLTTPVTGDITLVAQWTVKTYQVTFIDGSGPYKLSTFTVNYGESIAIPTPDTGYVWSVSREDYRKICSVQEDLTVVLTPVDAKAYTYLGAWWSVQTAGGLAPLQKRNVTFENCANMAMNNGGSASFEIDAIALKLRFWTNAGLHASYTFYLDGHKIGAWEFDNTQGEKGADSGWLELLKDLPAGKHTLTISGTGTITAMQIKEYHPAVTVDPADGSTPTVSRVEMFGSLSALTDPVRAGYNFVGWTVNVPGYEDKVFSTEEMKAVSVPADITVTAKWEKAGDITVTVNFNDGETADAQITVPYSEKIADLADPTREGYLFRGWMTDLAGDTKVYTTAEIKEISVTAAMTITAQWISADTRYTVTVSYNDDGTTPDTAEEVQIGHNLSLADPVRAGGYVFKGWTTDLAGYTGTYTTAEINAIAVESAFTVTAQWAQAYTVTFVNASENDAEIATVLVEEGGNAVLPTDADYYFILENADDLFHITGHKTIRLTPVHKSLYETTKTGMNSNTKDQLTSDMGMVLTNSVGTKQINPRPFGFVAYEAGQAVSFTGDFAGAVKFFITMPNTAVATFTLTVDGTVVSTVTLDKAGGDILFCEQLSAGTHTVTLTMTEVSGEGVGQWGGITITQLTVGIAQRQGA